MLRTLRQRQTTPTMNSSPLRRAQLNVYDPAAAIRGAHSVCGQFARGRSRADIVGDVLSGSPVTPLGAVDFVADAVAFYCPQYAGR